MILALRFRKGKKQDNDALKTYYIQRDDASSCILKGLLALAVRLGQIELLDVIPWTNKTIVWKDGSSASLRSHSCTLDPGDGL